MCVWRVRARWLNCCTLLAGSGLDRRRCFLDPAQCPCLSGTRDFSRRSTVLRISSRSSQPLCSNSLVCAQFPSGIWPGSLVDLLRFDRVYRAQWGGVLTDRTRSATPVDTFGPVRADGDGCTGCPSLGDQVDDRSLTRLVRRIDCQLGKTWLTWPRGRGL